VEREGVGWEGEVLSHAEVAKGAEGEGGGGSHKEHKEHKDDFGAGASPQFTCRSLRRQGPECELIDVDSGRAGLGKGFLAV